MKKYRGVFPVLYACYDALGHIDPRRVRNMTRYLCEGGASGVFVNGKPGDEFPLSVREKIAVMENVMAQAEGQALVLCQVGCDDSADSMELARRAAACGADAAAVLRPGDCGSLASLLEVWHRIADCAGDTDMIYCDLPLPANDDERKLLCDFAAENRMGGIVVPDRDGADFAAYREVYGEDVSLFSAREADFETSVLRGADAITGYLCSLAPEIFVRLESAVRFNAIRRTSEDGAVIRRLYDVMDNCTAPSAVAREVLKAARGVDCGAVRPPFREMAPGDAARAEECIRIIRGTL